MTVAALFLTGLVTGLVAGGASCAAVQGGLLAGAVTRRADTITATATTARTSGESRASGVGGEPGATSEPRPLGPVLTFLTGKLVSHTMLGALLGAFGAVLQPSARVQAILLLVAGALMLVFALDLMGVRALSRWTPRPPVAWMRLVRRSSRSGWVLTPAVLGFLTVLLPCGVTLSVELIAVTSGSPLSGAAVMAGFVLGTGPLFAVLGYLLRQSTKILQGRLRVVTGIVVLAVAVWTAVSGLRLGGWISPAEGIAAPAATSSVQLDAARRQTITLQVDDTSYAPQRVTARAATPTTLILRTEGTNGCTRAFVIPDLGVQQILPETGSTSIDLGSRPAGTLQYSCAMGMYGGEIVFAATS